jgi:hypothetical protein
LVLPYLLFRDIFLAAHAINTAIMIVPRTIKRMIAQIGNLGSFPSLPVVVPPVPSADPVSEGTVQHPGSHGYCASPSWNAQIIFGPDSVPVAGVIPGVT